MQDKSTFDDINEHLRRAGAPAYAVELEECKQIVLDVSNVETVWIDFNSNGLITRIEAS